MEVTNKKERNNAFFQFIGIFLGSILIVNLALFFDYKFPTKQVNALKHENAMLKKNQGSNQEFQQFYADIEAIFTGEEGYIEPKKINEAERKISSVSKQFSENELVTKLNSICYKVIELNKSLEEEAEKLKDCRRDLRECSDELTEYKENYD